MTRLLHPIAALLLTLVVVLPGLGGSGLLDPWEMERAATARGIAGHAQVLVVDKDGKLLRDLSEKAPGLALRRIPANAGRGLRVAATRLGDRLTHGLVVDLDAIVSVAKNAGRNAGQNAGQNAGSTNPAAQQASWDSIAGQLDQVQAQNRGIFVLLVSDTHTTAAITRKLAEARARSLRQQMQGGYWRFALPEKDPEWLAALLIGTEHTADRAQAAAILAKETPSPWSRVQHKVDHHSVQAPLLDTWLVALSLNLFGSSEFAARLPGALLAALTALLLFIAMSRIFGLEAAWIALVVYLTLPLMIGNARLVTLAQTAPLGVALTTFGLALGVSDRARSWALWLMAGLTILFLGRGLGGLTMGVAICAGYLLVSADLRRGPVLAAVGSSIALAVACMIVLADDASALSRSFRFTQMPFGGGLPQNKRDFSHIVGMIGFSLYPWGAIFLMAMGRLLVAADHTVAGDTVAGDTVAGDTVAGDTVAGDTVDGATVAAAEMNDSNDDDASSGDLIGSAAFNRVRIALIMGFGAPLLIVVALLPEFHQLLVPVAAIVAAVTAILLRDIRLGRTGGPVLTLLIVIPTLLLHREIGKEASTLVRWLAWDPPFGGDSAVYQWPQELKMNRGLRAIAFLSIFAFALGLARPVAWLRRAVVQLERARATAWLLGGLGVIWTLDALISLGTRADVLLRAEALRTGYGYDRMWTAIQMTRPEVIAGGTAFVMLVIGAAMATRTRASQRPWAWLVRLAAVLRRPAVALGVLAVAAMAQLITGLLVWAQYHGGFGQAFGSGLAAGLTSAAFVLPALIAAVGGGLCWWATRRESASGSILSAAVASLNGGALLVGAVAALVAVGGIGVGASQAAGTWSYAFMASTWILTLLVALVIGGRAGTNRGTWGLGAFAVALVVAGGVATVLATRLMPLMPHASKYLLRVAIAAPDSALWVILMVGVLANHLARSSVIVDLLRYTALEVAALIERPRLATALPMLAAIVMTAGYAFGLLPELSVHFSQKHLLQRTGVDAADAADARDKNGVPRIFKYAPGGRHTIARNFYTQTMPTLTDRATAIALLGGKNVAARVTDYGPESRSVDLAIPGWNPLNDADKDGKRDHNAWFGIADKVGGKRVEISAKNGNATGDKPGENPDNPGKSRADDKTASKETAGMQAYAHWRADQWQGATLYNGRGQRATVASNDATSLLLTDEISLAPHDPASGSFALESADVSAIQAGKVDPKASAMEQTQRFVVVPKDGFSELNFHFRRAHKGRHIPVVDARSSRLVLTATHLTKDQQDDSWLAKHVLTRKAFENLKGVLRTEVNFDDKLFIVGYHLAEPTVRRAKKYKLTIFFEVRKGLASSYMIFMHPHPLHRDLWPGAIHAHTKREGKRCTGCFQTNHWLQNDIISVVIEQEVPLGTTAGSHDIIMGLFNPLNDKRLIIKSATGPGVVRHNDNRVTLGKLVVR